MIPENQFTEILIFCQNDSLPFDRYTQYLPVRNRAMKFSDIQNLKTLFSQGCNDPCFHPFIYYQNHDATEYTLICRNVSAAKASAA